MSDSDPRANRREVLSQSTSTTQYARVAGLKAAQPASGGGTWCGCDFGPPLNLDSESRLGHHAHAITG